MRTILFSMAALLIGFTPARACYPTVAYAPAVVYAAPLVTYAVPVAPALAYAAPACASASYGLSEGFATGYAAPGFSAVNYGYGYGGYGSSLFIGGRFRGGFRGGFIGGRIGRGGRSEVITAGGGASVVDIRERRGLFGRVRERDVTVVNGGGTGLTVLRSRGRR
jgi:hypothetical protein